MADLLEGFFGFIIPILGPSGSPGKCVNGMGLMADNYKRRSATIKVSTSLRRDDTIESFNEPMPDAAGSYLRMYPDVAEVQEAWEEFTGRGGPLQPQWLLGGRTGGRRLRGALFGTVGPVRYTYEAARKALLVLGARNVG
jgi:hypothetical protein